MRNSEKCGHSQIANYVLAGGHSPAWPNPWQALPERSPPVRASSRQTGSQSCWQTSPGQRREQRGTAAAQKRSPVRSIRIKHTRSAWREWLSPTMRIIGKSWRSSAEAMASLTARVGTMSSSCRFSVTAVVSSGPVISRVCTSANTTTGCGGSPSSHERAADRRRDGEADRREQQHVVRPHERRGKRRALARVAHNESLKHHLIDRGAESEGFLPDALGVLCVWLRPAWTCCPELIASLHRWQRQRGGRLEPGESGGRNKCGHHVARDLDSNRPEGRGSRERERVTQDARDVLDGCRRGGRLGHRT